MATKKEVPLPVSEVPPEVRHVSRGLWRWIEERRARGIPLNGVIPICKEGCTLHDHE